MSILINFLKVAIVMVISVCAFSSVTAENQDNKMHVVVAMPYQPGKPFDPHWYTPEYVNYIAKCLPENKYYVTGYFVSLDNIPKFLDDMKALYDAKENLVVLNMCDGGEWDGYPGISVLKQWEKHAINGLVPMTGSDSEFIYNSDDKLRMNKCLAKAKLRVMPQTVVLSKDVNTANFKNVVKKANLQKSWPLFCKLNIGAGALGISADSICRNLPQLEAQVKKMHAMFPKSDILIQPYLPGPEYTILVVKDRAYAAIRRDFHNPENLMQEDYMLDPTRIADEITYYPTPEHVQQLAIKAIQAIPGKAHYTRVDLREDGKGHIYVLDINDRPGFGEPSTVKCMLDFHHLSESQFLQDLIETAVADNVKTTK